MGRWLGGAQERLQAAAIDLFAEQGYQRVTVADIAARAGLTERTFYNHFTDKREALFPDQRQFIAEVAASVEAGESSLGPLEAVCEALVQTAGWYDQRRDAAARRRSIIEAHQELVEREASKTAELSAAVAGALQLRGSTRVEAVVTAAAAVAAYRLALVEWLDDPVAGSLELVVRSSILELRGVAGHWQGGRLHEQVTPDRAAGPGRSVR